MKRVGLDRREFLTAVPLLLMAKPSGIPDDLKTPYKVNRLVVAPSKQEGSFDELSVDVPFVFRDGDGYLMTYVGFDGQGYQTGLASSRDLLHWTPEGLIISRDPNSPITKHNIALSWILRENDVFSAGRLKKVNGRYLGTYHAYPGSGYEAGPAVIGLCWSDNLRNWEIANPCLMADEGRPWENGGLYKSCLLEHDSRYYMFYNAKNRSRTWNEQIGFAFSDDLRSWHRHPDNPVIPNGALGSYDDRFCADPCVLAYKNGWAVFYYGYDQKGVARDLLALSSDLARFQKCEDVLIDVGAEGSVDSKYAHKPSVIYRDGVLYHFYCAVSEEHGRGICVATSRLVGD
jgi:predicted GH43/DUF377 family glycosyl hydrolase